MNGTGRCVVALVWVLSAAPAWGQTVTVRVATFNIENFDSNDAQQFNAARDILIRVGADVVCLQEMSSSADFFTLTAAAGYNFGVIAGTGGDVDTGNNDIAAVMSKHPFVNTSTHTSASLSGDPSALDLTRNFILATVNIPNAVGHLIMTGNHWKAGNSNADEFRRSIESIRSLQVVAGLDSAVDAYLIVGDQNDDVSDSPDSPAQFNSLPSGLPVSFSLGNDMSFPVANGVFLPLFGASGSAHVNIVTAFQLFSQSGEPLDSTRPASGRRLDYIWHSDALTLTGQEVYDSRDEGLGGGGLPKFGSPLPSGTSADASDHLLVFAEYTMAAVSGDGACCHSGDVCVDDVDQSGCDALSGFFHGTSTTCQGPLDPPCTTLGACCTGNMTCSDGVDDTVCVNTGGFHYGPGTTCAGPLDPLCEPIGACCPPGGNCVDYLGAGGCAGVAGFYYGDGTTCAGPLDPACEFETAEAVINEVLAAHDGTDDMEFIELFGPPLGVLDGLSVVIIEGQTASKGLIDRIIDLTGQQLGSDGYFVMGDSDGGLAPDLVVGTSNIFENGSQTFLLVDGLVGSVGTDVDGDNDGFAEVAIGTILDAVGLVGGSGHPDYAIYYGAPEVGPQGGLFPAGGARIPNGVDSDASAEWHFLSALLDGSDGDVPITPGAVNPALGGNGDFDGSGRIDLGDYAAFQRCYTGDGGGPPQAGCEPGDLDGDNDLDLIDLTVFEALMQGP